MPTYDPLTPSQIALLAEIKAQPLVLSVQEQTQSQRGKDIMFLSQAGFLMCEQEHVAQDPTQHRFKWSRSGKSYP